MRGKPIGVQRRTDDAQHVLDPVDEFLFPFGADSWPHQYYNTVVDPDLGTNEEAIEVILEAIEKGDKLRYPVGQDANMVMAARKAEKNKEWVIGYFYEPQWFMSEVPLVKVNLPPYTDGCDADPAKVACDYPKYDLNKIVATKFVESREREDTRVGPNEPGARRCPVDERSRQGPEQKLAVRIPYVRPVA